MAAKIEKDANQQQQDTNKVNNAEQTESNTPLSEVVVVVEESTMEAGVDVDVTEPKQVAEEFIDINLESDAKDKGKESEAKPKKPLFGGRKLLGFFTRKPKRENCVTQTEAVTEVVTDPVTVPETETETEAETTTELAPKSEKVNDFERRKKSFGMHFSAAFHKILPKKKAQNDIELGKANGIPETTEEEAPAAQVEIDEVDKAIIKSNETEEIGSGSGNSESSDSELKKSDLDCDESKKETDLDEKQDSIVEELKLMNLKKRLRSRKYFVPIIIIIIGFLLSLYLLVNWSSEDDGPRAMPLRDGNFVLAVTSCGFVEGVRDGSSFAFRGLPYAQKPIGDLRWRPAKLIENIEHCWNGTQTAIGEASTCTQRNGGVISGDEDCLYLDVNTPEVRYHNPFPVVVLISADSLTGPSPGNLRLTQSATDVHKVVFVRPNFRLGALGFLAADALTNDTYPRTSGNYGLSDIIAALKWIQLNIYHFGGDPKSVTLWGHRAGATLVSALVSSKQAKGLYTRAWTSSSSAIFPGKSLKESEKLNEQFMQAVACKDMDCLRNLSIDKICSLTPDTWLHFPAELPSKLESTAPRHEWLVLDGNILQHHPSESWTLEGTDPKPQLVIGTTAHESHSTSLYQRYSTWTADKVRAYIQSSQIGELKLTNEVIELYNATNYRALVSIISDIRTICPLLTNARLQPNVPFYVVTQGTGDEDLAHVYDDVEAILGQYDAKTVEQKNFVSTMQQMFFTYVTNGTVPKYNPRRRVINVGESAFSQEDYDHCNYWISKDIVPRYARVD